MLKTRSKSCNSLLFFVGALILITAVGQAASQMTCPDNEFYTECGEDCQTECATLMEPCQIRHIKCPSGCFCNRGYARDASGTCVRFSECIKNWYMIASRNY